MTDGPLEFTVERNAKPVSDEVRASILNDPPFGQFHTDHMVSIDYLDGKGWHNARVIPYGPIELDPSAIVLHYAQEVFEGLKAYRWADGSIVSFRPEANASAAALLGAPAGDPRAARRGVHRVAAAADRRRRAMGAAGGRRGVAVPAALHLRHRAGAGCAAGERIPLSGHRLARGSVLQGRHQAGQRVAVDGVRACLPRRHRRGQVRRQLRRVAAGPGPGRRERLRSGGVAGRRRNAATSKRWAG